MFDGVAPRECDLLIEAGRAVCTSTGRDGPAHIAIRGDRIIAVDSVLSLTCRRRVVWNRGLVVPGLIDLHAHPAKTGSVFGVDPDRHCLPTGVTTVMSQGDAGADGCDEFVRTTIERSQTRVVLAINLSRRGEAGPEGCLAKLRDAAIEPCLAAVDRQRKSIWGISVNASRHACGDSNPEEIVSRGLHAAEVSGLPILYGMRQAQDWPLADQLRRLRRGDVVTYCYRLRPHCIVENERVLPEVRAARERGILFDVGHGRASFCFDVASQAIADGFAPDTVSTDLQRGHVEDAAAHDLSLVMSKLLAAGMDFSSLLAAVTTTPAAVLRQPTELGCIAVGASADLVHLDTSSAATLDDTFGKTRTGPRWQAIDVVRAGVEVEGV